MNRILITVGIIYFLFFTTIVGSTTEQTISSETTLMWAVKNICMNNINNQADLLKVAIGAGFIKQPNKENVPPEYAEIITLKKTSLVLDYDTKGRACSLTDTVSYKAAIELIVPMFGLSVKDYTYLTDDDGSLVAIIGIFNSTKEPTFEFNLVFPPVVFLKEQPNTNTKSTVRMSVIVYETTIIKNSRISI